MNNITRPFAIALVLILALAACAADDTPEATAPTDDEAAEEATEPEPVDEPDTATDPTPTEDTEADVADAPAEECDELETVRLAVPAPSLNFMAYYLGEDEGIFEENCIDLEVEVVRGDAAVAALLSDEIDFTAAGGTAMRAALEGAELRAVMITVAESTTSLVVQPEIETTADIVGASIAVLGTGDSLAFALNDWLRSEGLDPQRDVELLTVNTTPDAFSSLVGGAVQGAMLTPPFDAQAEDQGMRVLVRVSDFFAGSQGQVATTTDKIAENPESIRRFIHAALDSINFLADNPERARDFVIDFLDMENAEIAERSLEVFVPALALDGQASTEALLSQLPEGTTEEELQGTVDFSILEQVLEERG